MGCTVCSMMVVIITVCRMMVVILSSVGLIEAWLFARSSGTTQKMETDWFQMNITPNVLPLQAGAANTLDAGTLRALAEAVLNGAASSQQDGQAAELARSILSQPNAVTNALVNQLAQLQVQQNQQLQQQVRMPLHHAYDTFCNMTWLTLISNCGDPLQTETT